MLPDSLPYMKSDEAIARQLTDFNKRLQHLERLEDPAGGLYECYVYVNDEKPQNTWGGGFVQGAWRVRDINQEQSDDCNICTIAVNQITLDAGTYRCIISCPAYEVSSHQARLYNVTGAAVLLIGSSQLASAGSVGYSRSFIVGQFTLAVISALEVQHRCAVTALIWGFGTLCNFTTEVFTQAEFFRES